MDHVNVYGNFDNICKKKYFLLLDEVVHDAFHVILMWWNLDISY